MAKWATKGHLEAAKNWSWGCLNEMAEWCVNEHKNGENQAQK